MEVKRLPKGWKEVVLNEVLNYEQPNPYIIKSDILEEETSIPVLTANKGFIKGYTKETKGVYNKVPAIIFDDFTADNKFVNFPFKVKSSAMKILTSKRKDVNLKFIFYQMQVQKVNTTTHKRYYLSKYRNLEFLFPINKVNQIDFDAQQSIVSAIETQFTRLDEAVKSLKLVREKLRVYRKAVLKKAFEKKEGWEEISVKDMGDIITGKTPKTSVLEYYGEDFCFFKPGDLDNGYFVNNSETKLSKEGIKVLKKLPEKSIMVTCIGATIGKTGLNRIEGATNQQINSVIVNQKIFIPEFLYYLFISETGQRNIIDNSSSTSLPILNKGKFERLKFTVSKSIAEQSLIVSAIESKFSVIDKVEEIVNQALLKAEKLRKSILKSAFEGKLVKTKHLNMAKIP